MTRIISLSAAVIFCRSDRISPIDTWAHGQPKHVPRLPWGFRKASVHVDGARNRSPTATKRGQRPWSSIKRPGQHLNHPGQWPATAMQDDDPCCREHPPKPMEHRLDHPPGIGEVSSNQLLLMRALHNFTGPNPCQNPLRPKLRKVAAQVHSRCPIRLLL